MKRIITIEIHIIIQGQHTQKKNHCISSEILLNCNNKNLI